MKQRGNDKSRRKRGSATGSPSARRPENGTHPRGFFSYVWQPKDFKSFGFVCVAGKGLTGAFFVCVAGKGVSGKTCSVARVPCSVKEIGKGKSVWVFFLMRLDELGEADFKSFVFVCVAAKGLTGAFFVCVAGKGVRGSGEW